MQNVDPAAQQKTLHRCTFFLAKGQQAHPVCCHISLARHDGRGVTVQDQVRDSPSPHRPAVCPAWPSSRQGSRLKGSLVRTGEPEGTAGGATVRRAAIGA